MTFFERIFGKKVPKNDQKDEFLENERISKLEMARQKRELDLEINKLKSMRERLELRAEIRELKEDLGYFEPEEETGGSNLDNMLGSLLMSIMSKNKDPIISDHQPAISPPSERSNSSQSLADDQIRGMIANIPKKYLKIARGMSDDQLAIYIRNQLPLVDQDTINRSIKILRED